MPGLVEVSAIPFRSHDDQFYHYIKLILHLGCYIVIVKSGILLYRGSLSRGFVPYIILLTLAGLKNVNRYIGNIVLSTIIMPWFHCSTYYCLFRDNVEWNSEQEQAAQLKINENSKVKLGEDQQGIQLCCTSFQSKMFCT